MTTQADILDQLRQVRYDLSVTQTRVDEIRRAVAALPFPPAPDLVCPDCRARQRSALALAEHRYNAHDGPLPAHYARAEELAGFVDVPMFPPREEVA